MTIETTRHKMKPAILASLNALVDYLFNPVVTLWVAAHVALWEEGIFTKDRGPWFDIWPVFSVLADRHLSMRMGTKNIFALGERSISTWFTSRRLRGDRWVPLRSLGRIPLKMHYS